MDLTQAWLHQNVQSYANRDRVFTDIDNILRRFQTLRPKSDVYTFDDGRTQLLLCVHGLLPILYRGASYNIPLNVWIPRDYPREPPLVYVVPTTDMLVRPSRFLDVSGRCSHEYIQHWQRKNEGCNLSDLLESLQDNFSKEPPVYAKPASIAPQQTQGPPPIPVRPVISPTSLPQSPRSPPKPPPPPPVDYRPASIAPAASQFPRAVPATLAAPPSISSPPQSQGVQSPQVPPRPPNSSPLNFVSNHPQYRHAQPQGPPPPPPPPPPPAPPLQTPIPLAAPYQEQGHTTQPSSAHFYPQVRQEPPRPVIPNILDDDDIVSALPPQQGDPLHVGNYANPPPRPPNPELLELHRQVHAKLTSELQSLTSALGLDAERLRAHQNDLLTGEPAIRDEMARLEAVRDVCKSVATRTRDAVERAESNIAELRRKGDPEVDELVCATSIVHNQLINLIAEDHAIEDTIYHLHRGLNTGRLDLDRFLRTTRVLAEEQFMKRALINKIQASV